MNKAVFPFVLLLAGIVGVSIVVRQYSLHESDPIGAVTNSVSPTIMQDESMEGTVVPTNTAHLVSGIQLDVTTPSGNVTVASSTITVRGKTVAGAEVFVNDAETIADANGNFFVTIVLDEGENYILVVANDSSGTYTEKEFTVTYSP